MSKSIEAATKICERDDHQEIICSICDEAESRFTACGAAEDFGVQHVSCTSIIFGGHNRIVWSAKGWYADESYCTKRFLDNWNKLYS